MHERVLLRHIVGVSCISFLRFAALPPTRGSSSEAVVSVVLVAEAGCCPRHELPDDAEICRMCAEAAERIVGTAARFMGR